MIFTAVKEFSGSTWLWVHWRQVNQKWRASWIDSPEKSEYRFIPIRSVLQGSLTPPVRWLKQRKQKVQHNFHRGRTDTRHPVLRELTMSEYDVMLKWHLSIIPTSYWHTAGNLWHSVEQSHGSTVKPTTTLKEIPVPRIRLRAVPRGLGTF